MIVHRSGTGYPSASRLPPIPDAAVKDRIHHNLFSFRRHPTMRPDRKVRKFTAQTQISAENASSLLLAYLETDSGLAPIALWDIAHSAPVGAEIKVLETTGIEPYYTREYFKDALKLVTASNGEWHFKKVAHLDAEAGDPDKWTFAIPAGPDDPTLLNACVARILELDVPHKEILLCGRPSAGFKYWDFVRIVGEDITAPPVQICKKKNRLAQEASYENICMLHDRVFLPKNFGAAMRRFGNAFPFTTLHSLYFDDRFNFCGRRYSDVFVSSTILGMKAEGIRRSDASETSRFSPAVLPKLEDTTFLYANGHRYGPNMYASGSLYICKKAIWNRAPQDESLLWTEFEDVEQGSRSAALGIPSRVNPWAVTQSLLSRPIMNWVGATTAETMSGGASRERSLFESMRWIPRKPLLRKSIEQATADHIAFMRRWGVDIDSSIESPAAAAMHTQRRLKWITEVVDALTFELTRANVKKLAQDFEKLVVSDQLAWRWKDDLLRVFCADSSEGREMLLNKCGELFNHAAQRPGKDVYASSHLRYLPTSIAAVLPGSLLSGFGFWLRRKRLLSTRLSPVGLIRAILSTTPTEHYARVDAQSAKKVGTFLKEKNAVCSYL